MIVFLLFAIAVMLFVGFWPKLSWMIAKGTAYLFAMMLIIGFLVWSWNEGNITPFGILGASLIVWTVRKIEEKDRIEEVKKGIEAFISETNSDGTRAHPDWDEVQHHVLMIAKNDPEIGNLPPMAKLQAAYDRAVRYKFGDVRT